MVPEARHLQFEFLNLVLVNMAALALFAAGDDDTLAEINGHWPWRSSEMTAKK